ncbi:MAG: glutamate 5-kinase [Pseudomonadales bacterium]
MSKSERWVIKIGSALMTANGQGLALPAIAGWAAQMAGLRTQSVELVVVSSGSIAAGISRLGWQGRPREIHKLQAAAAVGQMGLVQAWESHFQAFDLHTAQVLLVNDDVANRERYLNARKTLNALLAYGVIPIVNENDTVATEEICVGDNDNLAALVANLIYADRLLILTDQQGLFDQDPRANPQAKLIQQGKAGDATLQSMAGASPGHLGRGGMITKLRAAQRAAQSGTDTYIVHGGEEEVLTRLAAGEQIGTRLTAARKPAAARKQWIAAQLQIKGTLHLDAGASQVIQSAGRSLLPVGVVGVQGNFQRGDVVSCVGPEGVELARGLTNYAADDARKIMGLASDGIVAVLETPGDAELIHRDNLVLL